MQETRVQCLAQEDPPEKEMAAHSSIPAWRIPWTEEPSRLQSMGSQRVGHDWATNTLPSSSRGGTEEKNEPSTRHRRYTEERINSPEGKGHSHRGGDADEARVRVTVYTDSQTHSPVRTMSEERYYTKALHPLPYCKSPTQWCKVSGWDTLDTRANHASLPH